MKNLFLGLAISLLGFTMVVPEVEAKRMGGARSSGAQRSATSTPPATTPAKPGQTSQMNQTQQAAPAGAAAAPAAASGLSRFAPMLGGLALGGLLGYMLGGSAGGMLLTALMIGLLALVGFVIFRMLTQRRAEGPQQPLQYAGLGSQPAPAPAPAQLSGFDARASAAAPSQAAANVPAGFDVAGFVKGSKMNFMRLQAANDNGNVDEIREFTTPEMFEELHRDIQARAGAKQQTDVVSLEAELLEVVTEGDLHWASVRFTGMIRETPAGQPEHFVEVWNLAKPVSGGSGWVLAGIQQMH